jgi:hypothetical protein
MTGPTDVSDRLERLRTVAIEMDGIVRDVGPKLIRLAHLRNEARQIREEIGAGQGR